jgi:hypothetical protein
VLAAPTAKSRRLKIIEMTPYLVCFQSKQWIEDRIRCYATIRYRSILLANYFPLIRLSHSPNVLDYSQKQNSADIAGAWELDNASTAWLPSLPGSPSTRQMETSLTVSARVEASWKDYVIAWKLRHALLSSNMDFF